MHANLRSLSHRYLTVHTQYVCMFEQVYVHTYCAHVQIHLRWGYNVFIVNGTSLFHTVCKKALSLQSSRMQPFSHETLATATYALMQTTTRKFHLCVQASQAFVPFVEPALQKILTNWNPWRWRRELSEVCVVRKLLQSKHQCQCLSKKKKKADWSLLTPVISYENQIHSAEAS